MLRNCLSNEVIHDDLQCKVDVSNLVFDLKQTLVFEWCIVGCNFRNGRPKKCVEKGLNYVFKIVEHLKITVNITEGISTTIFMSTRNFTTTMNRVFHSNYANYEKKNGYGHDLELLITSH